MEGAVGVTEGVDCVKVDVESVRESVKGVS